MSRHDATNTNCDKNAYPGAEGVLCTCDVDPAEDRPAPSTVLQSPIAMQMAHEDSIGDLVLRGSHAAAYVELKAAARDLEAVREMLRPAEQRWRAALDRFHAEMLR
jgi:hypothetical protein